MKNVFLIFADVISIILIFFPFLLMNLIPEFIVKESYGGSEIFKLFRENFLQIVALSAAMFAVSILWGIRRSSSKLRGFYSGYTLHIVLGIPIFLTIIRLVLSVG